MLFCVVGRIPPSRTTWPPAPAEPPGGETWPPALDETCLPSRMSRRGCWGSRICLERRRKREMERTWSGTGWRGEEEDGRTCYRFPCVWWEVLELEFVSPLSLSAQGLPDHPGAGSVRGRGFGPGWRGSVGAVAWSQGRRRGGHEEEGQGAGHQWTSEERTALRWEGLQLD